MTIKVLSRDEVEVNGCLITRRDALVMSDSRCAPALLRFGASEALRLMDEFEEPVCAGYPVCDGDLVGLEHDEGCPLYGESDHKPKHHAEPNPITHDWPQHGKEESGPAPKWEPGMWAECSGCENHQHVVKFSVQEIRKHGWLVESLPPGGLRPHDPDKCGSGSMACC